MWLVFLEKWEAALQEDKEVIVTLDANIDFLTWRMDASSLPSHHSSVRLKPLIDALFDRIFPLGVTQLVMGATRMERGQPRSGLDHLYSNKPDKLSSVQTFFTGMSDHKLLKFTRFSKSFKQTPRYVRKRVFKDFDDKIFKQKVADCGLDDILSCLNVNEAAELLTCKLNVILDELAPVKKSTLLEVLSTVLDSTKGERQNLSELINLVWSMALDGILSARNSKLTPRADIIINNIKSTLLSVLKYKPKCSITECLKVRNLIRLLSSGFTPHQID